MSIKRAFIDTETTGTKWSSGIHQLALIIEVDGEVEHEETFEINPDPKCTIEDAALAVSGKSREQMVASQLEYDFFRDFQRKLAAFVNKYDKTDKLHFTAYNAKFDDDRLRDLFNRQGDRYYGSMFWNPVDCVMIRAGHKLQAIRHTLPDFKLVTVAKHFGIEWDESSAHDALYDIRKTRELFYALT